MLQRTRTFMEPPLRCDGSYGREWCCRIVEPIRERNKNIDEAVTIIMVKRKTVWISWPPFPHFFFVLSRNVDEHVAVYHALHVNPNSNPFPFQISFSWKCVNIEHLFVSTFYIEHQTWKWTELLKSLGW